MTTLNDWNSHQLRVFRRFCRLYGLALTAEFTARLGARYADKHAAERPAAPHPAPTRGLAAATAGAPR
jgi:hypothetical protein